MLQRLVQDPQASTKLRTVVPARLFVCHGECIIPVAALLGDNVKLEKRTLACYRIRRGGSKGPWFISVKSLRELAQELSDYCVSGGRLWVPDAALMSWRMAA